MPTVLGKLSSAFDKARRMLGRGEDEGAVVTRSLLTPEGFQEELALLGLCGKEFGPEQYAESLGLYLGIEVRICVFPDRHYPKLARLLALSGRVAELCRSSNPPTAVILVPGSLPPVPRVLATYHELGHLAAGDPLKVRGEAEAETRLEVPDHRLAREAPLSGEGLREREADLRAEYALLAGCLGPASPYAQRMYDAL